MSPEKLDCAQPSLPEKPPPMWDALAGLAFVAPFFTVPIFIIGTALLQDELINGDGRSWQRAAIRMAIPTGLVTGIAFIGAARVCAQPAWRRPATIFGLVVSSLALLFIIYATFTA